MTTRDSWTKDQMAAIQALCAGAQAFIDKCKCCSDLYKQIVQGEIDAVKEIMK